MFVSTRRRDWIGEMRSALLADNMNDEQRQFLNLMGRMPARLTAEQVGWILNISARDVPLLVAARLLKPLGKPPVNAAKYFPANEVYRLAEDVQWLAKVTDAIHLYWHNKNLRRNPPGSSSNRP